MRDDAADLFSTSYARAREQFVCAAESAGLALTSERHPLLGVDGEVLALDVARLGPPDARSVLLVSSGCHGVEGIAGSAVQQAVLGDAGLLSGFRQQDVALVLAHALNPWGFSWCRRTTQENVDLNRNFIDFQAPLPRNPGYDALAHAAVPADWPPDARARDTLRQFEKTHGRAAWQAAITGGQYDHPQGLFFGGRDPTWSHQALRHLLREQAGHCRHLGWIDLHSGLGPCGHGERIFAGRANDQAALQRTRAWWGSGVTALHEGNASSAPLQGVCMMAAYQECPQAAYTGIALEYGTVPLDQVIDALRADQWLDNHPQADARRRQSIKQELRAAFAVDTSIWRQQVLDQGLQAVCQALAGLASQG